MFGRLRRLDMHNLTLPLTDDLSEIERVSDDARWSINFDDVPTGLTDPNAKLSANEWAALLGKGALCSTEY